MICTSILLALLVALHGVTSPAPRVNAGSLGKLTRARQSTSIEPEPLLPLGNTEDPFAFDDAGWLPHSGPKRKSQHDDTSQNHLHHHVDTPTSAAPEQEVAPFMTLGGLAADLTPLPASRTRRRSQRKGREKRKFSQYEEMDTDSREKRESRATMNSESTKKARERNVKRQMTFTAETAEPDQNVDSARDLEHILRGEKDTTTTTAATRTPFYLQNVPHTKAGRLFEEHEKRYWEARERGHNVLGNGQRFFKVKNLGMNDAEVNEFRRLARKFTSKLNAKGSRQEEHKRKYRLKRFGPQGAAEKTEAQKRETHLKGRRNYLARRLKQCLASGDRTDWMDNHDVMLREYVAEASPFEPNDYLLGLYRKVLEAYEGMESCIQLPE